MSATRGCVASSQPTLRGSTGGKRASVASKPRGVAAKVASLDPPFVGMPRREGASLSAGPPSPIILTGGQKGYSLSREGLEIIDSLEPWVEENLLPMLKPAETCWQPQDLLPDPASEGFLVEAAELRERAAGLPDDLMVALVGDLVTEEALPTYMSMLNTLEGTRDESGASPTAWARWTRGWTAEENRHGDALGKYLWLSGRVDPAAVERTTQSLIGAGMDAGLENNPYLCFMYTSFQERATKVSHRRTARLAADAGDPALARLCGAIASDEARHEEAYQRVAGELFRVDPEGAVLALGDVLGKQVVMPGHLMDDGARGGQGGSGAGGAAGASGRGVTTPLFDDFAAVAERIGVYTAHDYAGIVEHLIDRWGVGHLEGLSGEGAAAQELVCGIPGRVRRLADVSERRRARRPPREAAFAWLGGRKVDVS